jgi:hypothetical protein
MVVANVGAVAKTTAPVPVTVPLTKPFEASVNTGKDAVNEESIGCAVNVDTPVNSEVVLTVKLVTVIAAG